MELALDTVITGVDGAPVNVGGTTYTIGGALMEAAQAPTKQAAVPRAMLALRMYDADAIDLSIDEAALALTLAKEITYPMMQYRILEALGELKQANEGA